MSLDAGNTRATTAPAFENVYVREERTIFAPWEGWEPSRIAHHGAKCCEIAREWVVNTDYSALNGADALTGPRWLRERFDWGPGLYPINWCDVLKKSALDCGVLAALSWEIFTQRGVRTFRAQLVQEFAESAVDHWRTAWESDAAITAWINGNIIYHEGCAVLTGPNEIKLWDSSAGWWIDPKTTGGYGSLLAIRISAHDSPDLRWGEHVLESNRWIELK
jgi:hypothetical protein